MSVEKKYLYLQYYAISVNMVHGKQFKNQNKSVNLQSERHFE